MRTLLFIIFSLILIPSCADKIHKSIRNAKYSAYEKVGYEKRDIFKKEVNHVKEEQQETGEAFKDALTKLKEVYDFDGGNLEKEYNRLKSSYENADSESKDLKNRITQMNTVAGDLFEEWEGEIKEMKDTHLRSSSRQKLTATKTKYRSLETQVLKAEKKMEPVLQKLKDQVIYLKHNLNAEAIAGLKTESLKIQTDIAKLIQEVDQSSKEADALIKTL